MARSGINILAASILLAFGLLAGVGCFNHPLVGTQELAAYLGQSTDEDEADGELFAVLAAAGGGLLSAGDGSTPGGSTATEITLYSAGQGAGALGGIAGANAVCDASGNKPAGTTGVAFLSSDAQDLVTLSGVPAALPVVGPNATVISTTWAGLFDGGIDATLGAAGVLAIATDEFLSGTDASGVNVGGANCSNWTSAAGDSSVGRGNLTSGFWMDQNDPTNQCAGANHLLCAAW